MARRLYVDAVHAHDGGRFAECADKAGRSLALFPAPSTQLYVARCLRRIDRLVESAEQYRQLKRVTLEPGAPEVFTKAVASAKEEAPEVEGRVPNLRIDIEPAGVEGLVVRVGKEVVPNAALGVERPTNPGKLVVQASAPGYEVVQLPVLLAEGETRTIRLTLRPAAQSPKGDLKLVPQPDGGTRPRADSSRARLELQLALRAGATLPVGDMGTLRSPSNAALGAEGRDIALTHADLIGLAGGGELQLGIAPLPWLTVAAAVELRAHKPGPQDLQEYFGDSLKASGTPLAKGSLLEAGTSRYLAYGLLLRAGSPSGTFGGFGELGVFAQRIDGNMVVNGASNGATLDCSADYSLTGLAARVAGGVQVPLVPSFDLAPYAAASFGGYSSANFGAGCGAATAVPVTDRSAFGAVALSVGLGGVLGVPLTSAKR